MRKQMYLLIQKILSELEESYMQFYNLESLVETDEFFTKYTLLIMTKEEIEYIITIVELEW